MCYPVYPPSAAHADRSLALLARVPHPSIKARDWAFQAIIDKKISLSAFSAWGKFEADSVERVILNSSKTLKELNLFLWNLGTCSNKLRIPPLPLLNYLDLQNFCEHHDECCLHPFPYVDPLKGNQFPLLEVVKLKSCHSLRSHGLFRSCRLPSVKRFELDRRPNCSFPKCLEFPVTGEEMGFGLIFPNLKALRLELVNKDILMYILKEMNHLEKLSVCLKWETGDGNLSSILAGVLDANEIYQASPEDIAQHRAQYKLPSIVSFKSNFYYFM